MDEEDSFPILKSTSLHIATPIPSHKLSTPSSPFSLKRASSVTSPCSTPKHLEIDSIVYSLCFHIVCDQFSESSFHTPPRSHRRSNVFISYSLFYL